MSKSAKGGGADGPIRELRRLAQWVRHVADQADAKVTAANGVVGELGRLGYADGAVVLGAVIHEREDAPPGGGCGTPHLVQAALLVPEGFGVVVWDLDEYVIRRAMPGELEAGAARGFVSYRRCEPLLRGLLLPQVDPLLTQLLSRVA